MVKEELYEKVEEGSVIVMTVVVLEEDELRLICGHALQSGR